MNPRSKPTQYSSSSVELDDIYYLLFRRKWVLIVTLGIALITSVLVFFITDTVYSSEAKIMIRYVMEDRDFGLNLEGTEIRSTSDRDNIINAEMQIMTSKDVIFDVAGSLTNLIEKIVEDTGSSSQREKIEAAEIIQERLKVSIPMRNNVVRLEFTHPDPTVPQEVLYQVVSSYLVWHAKIHNDIGDVDDLRRKAQEYQRLVDNAEANIQQILGKSQITSVAHTREMLHKQISSILGQRTEVNARLAEHVATGEMLEKWSAEDEMTAKEAGRVDGESDLLSPTTIESDYVELNNHLVSLKSREAELLVSFTPSMFLVQNLRRQIKDVETQLEAIPVPVTRQGGDLASTSNSLQNLSNLNPGMIPLSLRQEKAWIVSLQATTNSLTSDLVKFREQIRDLDRIEQQVLDFQAQKTDAKEKAQYYSRRVERADTSQTGLGDAISNISILQHASFPIETTSGGILAIAVFFIISLGVLALVVVWDLLLRKTVNRPEEVETKLELPLFMPVPEIESSNSQKNIVGRIFDSINNLLPWRRKSSANKSTDTEDTLHSEVDQYCEDLRDHLVGHFAIQKKVHKPKLVAITSSRAGSGTSTLSTGLARALSRAGQGRVLLVDLTGMIHKNKGPNLNAKLRELKDLLEERTQNSEPPVGDHIEVATAFYQKRGTAVRSNGSDNPNEGEQQLGVSRQGTSIPSMIHSLIPKFSESNYDYVIFDMPPISHSSITTRLVGLMDHTLLVLASGKVTLQTARMHKRLLDRVKADSSVVLNRYQSPVPWQS